MNGAQDPNENDLINLKLIKQEEALKILEERIKIAEHILTKASIDLLKFKRGEQI